MDERTSIVPANPSPSWSLSHKVPALDLAKDLGKTPLRLLLERRTAFKLGKELNMSGKEPVMFVATRSRVSSCED